MNTNSIVIHGLSDEMMEEWEEECKKLGVFCGSSQSLIKPLPLTRYILDQMDSAWNKILKDE